MKYRTLSPDACSGHRPQQKSQHRPLGRGYYARFGKTAFDIVLSVLLLPAFLIMCGVLLVLNPRFNRGPLFFVQMRMGRGCTAFHALKFRTMKPVARVTRGAEDPLEVDRITCLGRILRRWRIDELPQILNVLSGDMSLIGPRPDYFHHARRYVRSVQGYRARHRIRPGISGLAQTELGYVESIEGVHDKVRLDLLYARDLSLRMDLYVLWRTVQTVFGRKGC